MHSIPELQEVFEIFSGKQKFKTVPTGLYEPFSYMLSIGGKRIRPSLLLASCELFDGNVSAALPAAFAIELFHNFTLIHDDIMDESPLRRGMETVHKKWSTNTAIISGDVMLVKAYEYLLLSENRLPENEDCNILTSILKLFNHTATLVCEGQQADMNFERQDNVTVQDYLSMIEMKTATLLAASLKIGAMIADASNENATQIYEFGKHIGIAFQLQDDWLDTFGDVSKTGKQTGGDILRGKKTFLFIEAINTANENQREHLMRMYDDKSIANDKKIKAVKDIFNELNISELTKTEMLKHYKQAIEALNKITVTDDKKVVLRAFADLIVERNS